MSEEIKPDTILEASDVVVNEQEALQEAPVAEEPVAVEPEAEEPAVEEPAEEEPTAEVPAAEEPAVEEPAAEEPAAESKLNFAEKTLAELSSLFEALSQSVDRMKRSKEAEAIKSAFYRRLSKDKAEAGYGEEVDEPKQYSDPSAQEEPVEAAADQGPFAAIEAGFKSLYNAYRRERAEYNRQMEGERSENLVRKQAVIEDLKALVEAQEDVKDTFPKFREIQDRWRAIGPVPAQNYQDVNRNYQFYVEKFYDMVKINRDLRDLDFKKNLEAKEKFCEQAEELASSEDSVWAFRELQKLHEQWKEFGPVAKEFREEIWERFKAATAVVNRKYQSHFEGLKSRYAENLQAKTALCEKVEAIADKEIKGSGEWNNLSREIEEIQKEWRGIGFATKKENQKIYDRFRAACDRFFARKREFYTDFKDSMNDNLEKKMAIIEKAEELKSSTDWKKTSDAFIELQKQWKEIGAVPRKKSEQLWKRFRAACDEFFGERDRHAKPENDFHSNLKAKKAIIAEIGAYVLTGDASADEAAMNDFESRWHAIGFVPFKEKDAVNASYREAMQDKFPSFRSPRPQRGASRQGSPRSSAPRTEKDRLVLKYNSLQQDIATYENNIGFFASSKNSEPLIRQMQERIDAAKQELKDLEARIREMESKEEGNE